MLNIISVAKNKMTTTVCTPSFRNYIFQNLTFLKHHRKNIYDHVIILQPKSRKKCRKNFENRFINEIIMPKKYFEYAFCMCKGGNPNTLKMKIKQICGIVLGVCHSAIHTLSYRHSTDPMGTKLFIKSDNEN